jgi:hypothetical protein
MFFRIFTISLNVKLRFPVIMKQSDVLFAVTVILIILVTVVS